MAIRDAGYEIALNLMPKSIGPLTIVFTGSGNVSQVKGKDFHCIQYGWMLFRVLKKSFVNYLLNISILKLFHKLLNMVVSSFSRCSSSFSFVLSQKAINKIYGCVVHRKDHLINKETGQYDAEEFHKHPNRYTSTFKTKVSERFSLHSFHDILFRQEHRRVTREKKTIS